MGRITPWTHAVAGVVPRKPLLAGLQPLRDARRRVGPSSLTAEQRDVSRKGKAKAPSPLVNQRHLHTAKLRAQQLDRGTFSDLANLDGRARSLNAEAFPPPLQDGAGPSYSEYLPYLHTLNDTETQEGTEHGSSSSNRVKAYLQLTQHAPALLASVTDEGLNRLCAEAGQNAFEDAIERILDDLAPPSDVHIHRHSIYWTQQTNGKLVAPRGSTRRCNAIQHLVNAAVLEETEFSPADDTSAVVYPTRRSSPHVSPQNVKRISELLVQDVSLLHHRNNVDTSAILGILNPIAARWLMITIVHNQVKSLVGLVTALWHRIDVASFPHAKFPTLFETDHLIRFYLSMDDSGEDVAIAQLLPKDVLQAEQSSEHQRIPSLIVASQIIEAFVNAHPTLVDRSALKMADEVAENLEAFLLSRDVPAIEVQKDKESVWYKSIMTIVAARDGNGPLAERNLMELKDILTSSEERHLGQITASKMQIVPFVQVIFRILLSRGSDMGPNFETLVHLIRLLVSDIEPKSKDEVLLMETNLRLVRDYAQTLIASGSYDLALDAILATTDAFAQYDSRYQFKLAHFLGNDMIMTLIRFLAHHRDGKTLSHFLRSLKLVSKYDSIAKKTSAIDTFFPESQRVRLVMECAKGNLGILAQRLYDRWTPEELKMANLNNESAIAQLHKTIPLVPQKKSDLRKAEKERSFFDDNIALAVAQSSTCMSAVIHCVMHKRDRPAKEHDRTTASKRDADWLPPRVQKGYQVLFTFTQAKKYALWDYKDYLNVGHALFHLGHDAEAFHCLSEGLRCAPKLSSEELHAFARGMAYLDLKNAIGTLGKYLDQSGLSLTTSSAVSVLSPLAVQCLLSDNSHLMLKIIRLARKHSVSSEYAIRAPVALAIAIEDKTLSSSRTAERFADVSTLVEPGEVNAETAVASSSDELRKSLETWNWIRRLIEREEWQPDMSMTEWLVLRCTSRSERYAHFVGDHEASIVFSNLASGILRKCASRLDQVDHFSVMAVLKTIQSDHHTQKAPRKHLRGGALHRARIAELDRLVSVVRWVRTYRYVKNEALQARQINPDDWIQRDLFYDEAIGDGAIGPAQAISNVRPHLPNQLPISAFRALTLAYLRLDDVLGAASVMEWARTECGLTLDDLNKGFAGEYSKRTFGSFLRTAFYEARDRGATENMDIALACLNGEEPVERAKSWWQAPGKKGV